MNVLSRIVNSVGWPKTAASFAVTALALCFADSEGKAQPPDRGATKTVQGTVRRSTTAPKGEIDGAVLEDGTVIHWPPHLADRFSAIVARGDRVKVSGRLEPGPAGDCHFEVQSVTNLRTGGIARVDGLNSTPNGSDRSTDFAAPADRPNNVERRLKALEDQIAKLHEEIQKLRDEL
jgi:hypothetical protein